jgi:hypothetical protein
MRVFKEFHSARPLPYSWAVGLWFTAGRRKCWGSQVGYQDEGAFGRPIRFNHFFKPRSSYTRESLHTCAFRIFQSQLQFARQRLHGRPASLPRAFRLGTLDRRFVVPRGR